MQLNKLIKEEMMKLNKKLMHLITSLKRKINRLKNLRN